MASVLRAGLTVTPPLIDGEPQGFYADDMVVSTESQLIARPPSEVFAYAVDLRNEPSWDMDIDTMPTDLDSIPEVGREYPVRCRPFLGEEEGTLTVVEIVPWERLRLDVEFAGLTSQITCLFDSDGTGTRFTRQVRVEPRGMLRVLVPLIAWRVRRSNRRDVWALQRVLETVG